jgi:2-dehydro-3-deoxygluconokinase
MVGEDPERARLEELTRKYETGAAEQERMAPWMALAKAGFTMAGGKSPFAVQNLSEGAVAGLADYAQAKDKLDKLTEKQIDISPILKVGDRIGTYYLTQGFDMTNAGVVYDRQGSSFSCIKKGQIDWKKSLDGVKWFHFSAIAASLTQNAAEVCLEALQMAHLMGIPISLDLNYRPQLWRYGVAPIETMLPLMQYCDVVMGNIWSVEKLVGLKSSIASSEGASDLMLKNAALESINLLKERFPNLKSIALTFRLTNDYFAILHHADTTYCSSTYNLPKIVDKVGSGDCFMAGLLYGLNNYNNPQQTVDFAAKAAVGKLNELGDMTNQTIEMIIQNN